MYVSAFSIDLFARHGRARGVAAGGIADQAGLIADQKDHAVPQILKVLHLAQQHRVAQVQIGRRGIEARFHAQRTAGLFGLDQALAQVLFADQVGQAFLQVRQLFVDGHASQ